MSSKYIIIISVIGLLLYSFASIFFLGYEYNTLPIWCRTTGLFIFIAAALKISSHLSGDRLRAACKFMGAASIAYPIYIIGHISYTYYISLLDGSLMVLDFKPLDKHISRIAILLWVIALNINILTKQKLPGYILTVIGILLVILSSNNASKIAVLLSLASIFLYFLLKSYFIRFVFPTLMMAIVLIQPWFFANYIPALGEYTQKLPFSAQHRLYVWENTADLALSRPLTGCGINSAKQDLSSFTVIERDIEYNLLPRHPHNAPLQMFLEFGIIGLILYSFLWLGLSLYTIRLNTASLQASWIATVTSIQSISFLSYNIWSFWLILTISTALTWHIFINRILLTR